MARAYVFGVARGQITNKPVFRDDPNDGSFTSFEVVYTGADVPNGADEDIVEVHFLDTDTAIQMDNKVRDAVRAKSLPRYTTGTVISFAPPRRL